MFELYNKVYDPKKYHCVHFTIDAAQTLYGLNYEPCFIGLTGSLSETIQTSRDTVHRNKLIKKPKDGCIVLMTKHDNSSHVGLYYQNRVFHLTESGVHLVTVTQISRIFKRIRYYEPNLHH